PPTFSFSPLTNPNFSLYGDTAVWEVQHCNTSFSADAGLTWLAIEEPNGFIEVVSIEDISVPSAPVSLTVEAYGPTNNNYFAITPGVVKADGTSPLDQICNTLRIKALVSQCGVTNLNARVGWNCIAYSEPNWNPELYPPCTDLTMPLSVNALEPFLDANIIEQPTSPPDICDTSTVTILLRNTDLGAAFDVLTQIITPLEGMILVPGSFEVAYPPSAPYLAALSDPVAAGVNTSGAIFEYSDFSQLHPYLDQYGLQGFDPVSPTDSNEVAIRYRFTTDCDFKSGSLSFYRFQGIMGCGEASNSETGETLPLEINGADPTGNKAFDVAFSNNSALIPDQSNTLEITVVNQTTEPTDNNSDKVSLQLPLGVVYDLGSTVPLLPATWTTNTEPQIDTVGGLQVLSWCLPTGMIQNDTARFAFDLTSPSFDCMVMEEQVGLFTISRTQLFCDRTAELCDIDDITSTNNGQLSELPVLQKMLEVDLDAVLSTCQPGNEEAITINGAIVNPGVDFLPGPFTIRYYFDADDNGMVSVGDP
ncbi:MAG: hypothetical protein AAGD05_17605, partial [Bacteroidota bacterium]